MVRYCLSAVTEKQVLWNVVSTEGRYSTPFDQSYNFLLFRPPPIVKNMAEGPGGEAAVVLFSELARAASRVTQRVRERLSPPGTTVTWLGPSGMLSDALAGSVLGCESSEEGAFTVVVPPRIRSTAAPVKRVNGTAFVRVSRDGSLASARYEDIQTLHQIVKQVVPGVLTMGDSRGHLAHTVKSLASGRAATLTVSTSSTPTARPLFTVKDSDSGEVIAESTDFACLLGPLSVNATPWEEFTRADGWGLPPLAVAPVECPMQWPTDDDALSMATELGLPPVTSNLEVLQFLLGCCEALVPQSATVEELSFGFGTSAPAELQHATSELVLQLSVATPSRPDIVDSVRSRMRAIRQSPEAPDPFVAFGMAWRQGALEPPSRRPSRSGSPSAHGARRLAAATPPRAPATMTLDELNALTPNTMRQKLAELLVGPRAEPVAPASGAAATPPAATPACTRAPSTMRQPSPRMQHSGQLGGLFTQRSSTSGSSQSAQHTPHPQRTPAPVVPAPAQHNDITAPPTPAITTPSIAEALRTVAPDDGAAVAATVIIPAACHSWPVTSVVSELTSRGMPAVVTQFAQAAGDALQMRAAGSPFEAISLLRNIEEVFADVLSAAPSFAFMDRPPAQNWDEAVTAVQALLNKYSSVFRTKRHRVEQETTQTAPSSGAHDLTDEKLPIGSYKQVPTAPLAERAGACDAQLIEDIASAAVLRREFIRSSPFCSSTTTTAERDNALAGEIAHFCSTYGQPTTAYIFSNGMAQTALSGHGVPMALAAIRLHLLARITRLIQSTIGFERALDMHVKCTRLSVSFLTGLVVVEDCVTLLGGSAPHEDAEIRREGGATSTGTLGSTSGADAQLSIREAFALYGQGLHMVFESFPGVATSGTDFGIHARLKTIPRETSIDKLLSVCRYMTAQVGKGLYQHRTVRDAPLPDICKIIVQATTIVFQQRDLDQRTEERAAAMAAPLLARIEKLEAASAAAAKAASSKAGSPSAPATQGKQRGAAAGKSAPRSQARHTQNADARGEQTRPFGSTQQVPSAHEAAQQFMASLQSDPDAPPLQSLIGSPEPSSGGDDKISTRLLALQELSGMYRQHVGMTEPKGNPSQEPCAYKALFGNCGQSDCQRCASGKSFPQHMVDAVRNRCEPRVLAAASKTGGPKNSKKGGKAKQK